MTSGDDRPAAVSAGPREWIGLVALVLGTTLLSIDVTVVNLALPELSVDLRPTGPQMLWVMMAYSLATAAFLVPMGAVADRVGHRRLLVIGSIAFSATCVFAATSGSAEQLILARALQGAAGATVMPSILSLIRTTFVDDAERARALGYFMAGNVAGLLIGPVLGGALLEYFWWGAVFLINVPVMVVVVMLVLLTVRETPGGGRRSPFDVVGAAMLAVACTAVVYGLTALSEADAGVVHAATLGVGVGLIVALRFHLDRTRHPLVDLNLLRGARFRPPLIMATGALAVMVGTNLLVAQHLQIVGGLSPGATGLALVPTSLASVVGALAAPRLSSRCRPAVVLAGALVLGLLGLLGLVFTWTEPSPALVVVWASVLGLGTSIVLTTCATLVISHAPTGAVGAVSAVQETTAELGAVLGILLVGGLGTTVFRVSMLEIVPVGTPFDPRVTETPGAALAWATSLPPGQAEFFAAAVRTTFSAGLASAAMLGTIVLLTLLAATRSSSVRSIPSTSARSGTSTEETK